MNTRSLAVALMALLAAGAAAAQQTSVGTPEIRAMSALAFGPDEVLFVGDADSGAVWAIDLGDETLRAGTDPVQVEDIERRIAALLGTSADEVMIHDLAVHPRSQDVYLAVSRGRARWDAEWELPNDVASARILLRVLPDATIEEVGLDEVPFARAELPGPVAPEKQHPWKEGVSLRADTITDMAYVDGLLYVTGLSNEEFASTLWRVPYPFAGETTATSLEIFHGAHGEWETHAPIRTFVPYRLRDEDHLLAAYLCTPLVTFRAADLVAGAHVKGRTVGEFGSGNYPLDMVVVGGPSGDRLIIANSTLPMMVVDLADVEAFEGAIEAPVEGYLAGVEYEPRPASGVLQLDRLNEANLVVLQRRPNGRLDLVSIPLRRS